MKKKVIGLGEILWDMFPEGKKMGGAPANFAYHSSQLGMMGYVVSAVGYDNLGQEILTQLSSKKLNFEMEQIGFPTGRVTVTVDKMGVPQYDILEDVAWDNILLTQAMRDLARCADAVCFGTLAQRSHVSRQTINSFLDLVPQSALRVFDINLRQHYYSSELIEKSLQRSNALKINNDEVEVISNMFGLTKMGEKDFCHYMLHKYNLQYVILTKGENGSYVMNDKECSFLESPQVHVADTVGAGDSFTAAFVYGILLGENLRQAHQLAVRLSAYVCSQVGAMPPYPIVY
ncbi:MAG: hypothetical protein RL662_1145 [Bacteroidota bacterium]